MTNKLELLLNIHNNKEFRYSEEISQAVAQEILNIYDSYIDFGSDRDFSYNASLDCGIVSVALDSIVEKLNEGNELQILKEGNSTNLSIVDEQGETVLGIEELGFRQHGKLDEFLCSKRIPGASGRDVYGVRVGDSLFYDDMEYIIPTKDIDRTKGWCDITADKWLCKKYVNGNVDSVSLVKPDNEHDNVAGVIIRYSRAGVAVELWSWKETQNSEKDRYGRYPTTYVSIPEVIGQYPISKLGWEIAQKATGLQDFTSAGVVKVNPVTIYRRVIKS